MADVGYEAGAEIVCGPSLKAVLDRDWDRIELREEALELVLQVLQAVESWAQTLEHEERALAQPALETATVVREQDVQLGENGKASLIRELPKIDGSVPKTRRCDMGEKAEVCAWMDTNGMCSMTWIRV